MKRSKLLLLINSIIVLFLLVVITTGYRIGSAPKSVEGLSVDTCYAGMTLSWKKQHGASSYNIYASEDGGELKQIASCDKDCINYSFNDYKHDSPYLFQVAAVAKNPLTGKENEGALSEPVSALYDSSQFAQKIPILTYHFLCASDEPATNLTIPEDSFDEQMKYLHDNGYTTLTPDEFY